MACADGMAQACCQCDAASLHAHAASQLLAFPLLQVAYHAQPRHRACLREILRIVGRACRLQAEHLDECARLLAEVHACLYDLGVVEHHQLSAADILRQRREDVFAYRTVAEEQQLGMVALRQRELGNPLVGQGVVVVTYLDVSRVCLIHCRLLGFAAQS